MISIKSPEACSFYEAEPLRGGWSVRQLDRLINSPFYERTTLSRSKAAMIKTGAIPLPDDAVAAEDEIKDPFVLEFLGLRDEYSESDLEDALIKLVEKVIGQTERITLYPFSRRVVPEFERKDLREIIHPPCRIVYRREKGKILIARTGRSERLLKLS